VPTQAAAHQCDCNLALTTLWACNAPPALFLRVLADGRRHRLQGSCGRGPARLSSSDALPADCASNHCTTILLHGFPVSPCRFGLGAADPFQQGAIVHRRATRSVHCHPALVHTSGFEAHQHHCFRWAGLRKPLTAECHRALSVSPPRSQRSRSLLLSLRRGPLRNAAACK
jgi:hypothetical protein